LSSRTFAITRSAGFSHTRRSGYNLAVLANVPAQADLWAQLRWLATPDSRVLATILGAALVFAIAGAIVGWRTRDRDQTRK